MKNHVINKDMVIEAFYQEPEEADRDLPFTESHGFRVVLIISNHQDYPYKIVLDKNNEQACIDFIRKLGFIEA